MHSPFLDGVGPTTLKVDGGVCIITDVIFRGDHEALCKVGLSGRRVELVILGCSKGDFKGAEIAALYNMESVKVVLENGPSEGLNGVKGGMY